MTDSQCRIVFSPGTDASTSVTDLIRRKAQETKPLLAWAEPDPLHVDVSNSTGRRSDFEPLVCGMPSWPTDLPLVEARLFWASTALHVVVKEGGGCAWVRIEEASKGSGGAEVARSVIPVYTLRDLKRFGLQGEMTIKGLRAVEYRQQGRLVGWRLTIEEK
ncbi:MAG: hypothetical protein P9E67_09790 [Candidatus Competibacter sp.]|nr:hypothetical protein [Candidatus Competibacter sp.]